jgi:hypothetical protein
MSLVRETVATAVVTGVASTDAGMVRAMAMFQSPTGTNL